MCLYRYFLNYSLTLQANVCNRCHDLLMMPMNLCNIAIIKIKFKLSLKSVSAHFSVDFP